MPEPGFAYVTGGGSGIGRAAAVALARQGRAVVTVDQSMSAAEATAAIIREAGAEALPLAVDVTSSAEIQRSLVRGADAFGTLAVAVNSAGIQGEIAPTADCSESNWAQIIATNLTGTFLCMRHEIESMLASGGGAIVNIASNFGLVGQYGMPAYCASKHGVIGLSKSAALDYAQRGVRINIVCPGPIGTPLLDSFVGSEGSDLLDNIKGSVPMNRIGTADEVSEAIAWLASDAASYVTGALLSVDGGYVVP